MKAAQQVAHHHVVPLLKPEQEEAEREYPRAAMRFVEMGRRSNQLNHAPALKIIPCDYRVLLRLLADFPRLPENAVTARHCS